MNYLVLSFACAAGLASFAQFMTVESAAADRFDGETTAQSLNVRTGPGTGHAVVATVPHGTPVSILEIDEGWARISATSAHGALDGWVSGKYVDIYEMALPAVASAGFDEEIDDELPSVSQPVTEPEPEIAVVQDDAPVAETVTEVQEEAPTVVETLHAEQQVNETVTDVQEQVVASLESTTETGAVLEQVADAPSLEIVVEEEPAEVEVQVTSLANDDIKPQPVLIEQETPSMEEIIGPTTFEALDISCRHGYFSDALEACTTDIKVDVSVPEEFAGLITSPLNVKCDVGYNYEADGNMLTETKSDVVKVTMDQGQGSAVLESRIDFLFRIDGVTRVELGDISCGAASD